MAKAEKPAEAAKAVTVRLTCVYSMADRAIGPGEPVEVTAEEASRLAGLGVVIAD